MTWDVDPLTDPRLANIPEPEPDPTPNRKAFKAVTATAPLRYYAWEVLGAVAAWGHLPEALLPSLCDRVPAAEIAPTLETLRAAGALRRFVDCPKCREVAIWSLRPSHALRKIVSSAPAKHRMGFYGGPESGLTTTDFCALPKLVKHDTAAAVLASRLAGVLPAGWIFGARDARWSRLLRFPAPRVGETAFRQSSKTGRIERWADLVYVSETGARVAVEVTVSQNRSQLASKARWWGVSISERGGARLAGLTVVILDRPGRDIAGKAVCDAFPQSAGWDKGYRKHALECVLSASWEEWVSGAATPAGENGWRAYRHVTTRRKEPVRLAELNVSGDRLWAEGPRQVAAGRQLKGIFRCPGTAQTGTGG